MKLWDGKYVHKPYVIVLFFFFHKRELCTMSYIQLLHIGSGWGKMRLRGWEKIGLFRESKPVSEWISWSSYPYSQHNSWHKTASTLFLGGNIYKKKLYQGWRVYSRVSLNKFFSSIFWVFMTVAKCVRCSGDVFMSS